MGTDPPTFVDRSGGSSSGENPYITIEWKAPSPKRYKGRRCGGIQGRTKEQPGELDIGGCMMGPRIHI